MPSLPEGEAEHQQLVGELRPLEISTWKWNFILMDFSMGLPLLISNENVIWVIWERFTKSAYFFSLAQLYVNEIVCLHDVLKDGISD